MADNLGPYELQGELGRGAMAIVWRAFDTNLEREVAIKEPVMPANADSVTAAEFAARFVREGKAAAKLNHPGIVTIHAADIYDGRPAIVMELIEGETLATILSRGALEPQSALAVLDQLLDAAGYAHSKGVVHRDIKPDNVFVTHDGRIKLADFGIAHVGTGATLTQAGTVMGTPGYMAPEQVTGSPVDARADIFAIGAIAYEMLVGHNPFGATDGTAPTTIMYRIVHEPAPALPAAAFAGLPADLSPVIAAALAKDPAERLASAQDFRSALAGGPIVTGAAAGMAAPAPGFSPQATPTVVSAPAAKSNWTPYLLVGAAGIAVIAGLFMFAGGTPGGGATAPPAQQDATVGTIEPPAPSGPSAAEAGSQLQSTYSSIRDIGDEGGSITKLAKAFNKDVADGVSDSTISRADRLLERIDSLSSDVQSIDVPDELELTKAAQLELLGYCRIRVEAIGDAGRASQRGDGFKKSLDNGRAAKEKYADQVGDGRP